MRINFVLASLVIASASTVGVGAITEQMRGSTTLFDINVIATIM